MALLTNRLIDQRSTIAFGEVKISRVARFYTALSPVTANVECKKMLPETDTTGNRPVIAFETFTVPSLMIIPCWSFAYGERIGASLSNRDAVRARI